MYSLFPKATGWPTRKSCFWDSYQNGWLLVCLTTKLSMTTKRRIHIISNVLMQITWLWMLRGTKFHLNPSPLTLTMACVPEAMLQSLPVLDLWDKIIEIKSVVKSLSESSHFLHLIWQQIWMMEDISSWWNKAIFDWNYISIPLCQRL